MIERLPTALLSIGLLLAPAAACATTLHALAMGFDDYKNKVSLEGSRNDALDISETLRKRGVSDVTLVDKDARRADVIKAWTDMNARAAPGDLLIVSFSGHGNMSPEKGESKHRPDGLEKGFLLPLYDEEKFPEEQLRDEDLYDLFKASSDNGMKIIFIADACHSGLAVRGATSVPMKFQRFETHGKPLPPPPHTVTHRPPIAGLTIYSAADENQTIQEFTLAGQRRGALSYVVARGLEGSAAETDGNLTEGDLGRYLITNVRLWSNNTQIPSAITPTPDVQIFASAKTVATGMPELSPVAFFTEANLTTDPSSSTLVQKARDAELTWSAQGILTNAHGDTIARGVNPDRVQGAIDMRRVIDALSHLAGEQGRALEVNVAAVGSAPSDRFYVRDEKIKIEAQKSEFPFLTVVDLNADGTVQYLWPQDRDPTEWTDSAKPNFVVKVTPPFGGDTVLFIEADRDLKELHAQLKGLDGRVAPVELYDALRLWIPQVKARIGLQPIFTCSAVLEDGSCGS